MPNMVQIIKQAATEATEAGKPVNILYGDVVSADPLKIKIDQKLILDKTFLVLTRGVTDYEVEATVSHQTGAAGAHSHGHSVTTDKGKGSTDLHVEPDHTHSYSGKKVFQIHSGLKAGERVVMLRMQGGQRFLVLDRIGG